LNGPSTQRRERTIVLGLIALYLALACAWQGLNFYDDSMYLGRGIEFHASSFLDKLSGAPLYAFWFKGLALLFHDAVWRYFASWAILVVVVSSIPLWFGIGRSWLYALVLLSLPFFSICTYVSLFASMFFVAGMAWILRRQLSLSSAACMACALSFVVAFARPEYAYAVYITAAATVLALAFDPDRGSPRTITAKLLAVAALSVAMHVPMQHSSISRSGMAFAQHFNYRAAQRGLLAGDPWSSNYAELAFHVDTAHTARVSNATIGEFYRANPPLFLGHIRTNLLDIRTIILLLLVLSLAATPWLRSSSRALRPAATYLFLVALPVLVSSIVIFPRPHYAVIVIPSMLLLALQLVHARLPEGPPRIAVVLPLGLALMCVAIVARYLHRPEFDATVHANIAVVSCLRSIERTNGPGDHRSFDAVTIAADDVYFDAPRTRLYEDGLPTWAVFTAAMATARPSWIVIGPAFLTQYGQTSSSVAAYLTTSLGYTPHNCPRSTGVTVYTLPAAQSQPAQVLP